MKYFVSILALVFALVLNTGAQTFIQVEPKIAGYVVKYDCIDQILPVVVNGDTISYDTIYVRGYNDYQAIPYSGNTFDYWEVIVTWYDVDTHSVWIDTIYQDNYEYLEMMDGHIDTIDYDGWLDWDMGVPDLSIIKEPGLIGIKCIAHFSTFDTGNMEVNFPKNDNSSVTINIIGKVQWITVVDQTGNVIASTDRTSISLQGCPSGMYHIEVVDQKGKSIKIIK